MKIKYTKHALEEIENRNIKKEIIDKIINNPNQILKVENNRLVYQDLVEFENKKMYVVRVILEETKDDMKVITVYKTSKINKYWRYHESKI